MVSRVTIQRKMRHVQEFRTLPVLLKRLLETLENPRLSLEDIAAVVSKDQVLASQLLKTANSPFFGFTRRVSSIKQALVLLGVNAAKGLLLGVSVFHHVREIEGLWAHSVGTAIAAAVMARRRALTDHAELFAAGLLHDVGKVFLPKETLLDLQREARNRKVPIEVLILEMIEDYLEGSGKIEKPAGYTTKRPFSAFRPKRI